MMAFLLLMKKPKEQFIGLGQDQLGEGEPDGFYCSDNQIPEDSSQLATIVPKDGWYMVFTASQYSRQYAANYFELTVISQGYRITMLETW